MPLILQEATAADAVRGAEIESMAFGAGGSGDDDVLFPGPHPPDGNEVRGAILAQQLRDDDTTRWVKMVDTDVAPDAANSQMIGWAKWHFYTDKPRAIPRVHGPGSNPEACEAFFGNLERARMRVMGDRPYFYLQTLATHPQHQGRGAGATLLRWGLAQAQEAGLETYLESTKAGHGLYAKNGFRDLEALDTDLSAWGAKEPLRAWLMKWQPRKD